MNEMLCVPALVLKGEVWRLFSFMLIPPSMKIFFMLLGSYVLYSFGSSLERVWGAFYFNLYVLIGAISVVLGGFFFPAMPIDNAFLVPSVFLAFAYLFPEFEILIFFILPVKMKWIGMIGGAYVAFIVIIGPLPAKVFALASVANFLIFFGRDLVRRLRSKEREVKLKSEKKKEEATPFHTCSDCGATDLSHSEREFRYRGEEAICSECSDTSSEQAEKEA